MFLIDKESPRNLKFAEQASPSAGRAYRAGTNIDADYGNTYVLEGITVNVDQGSIDTPSGLIHLQPQLIDVLEVLVKNAGEVVTRDTLLEQVWGDKVVTEESLTRAISELRKAFNDKASAPKFIQTIPKKGYRLVCKPLPIQTLDFEPEKNDIRTPKKSLLDSVIYYVGAIILVLALALAALSLSDLVKFSVFVEVDSPATFAELVGAELMEKSSAQKKG